MRNNLIFCGIEETPNETPTESENKIRSFIADRLELAQNDVDSLRIERAHRIGAKDGNQGSTSRKIVVKFTYFKDREIVRKERTKLNGSNFYMHEQFPPEIIGKRKRLVPKMKAAEQQGRSAWIAYDTLYIDGKSQRDA